MSVIDELLQQLIGGALSLDDARVQLARLSQLSGQNTHTLIAAVQRAVVAGRLEHAAARALIETITNANECTQLSASPAHTSARTPGAGPRVDEPDETARSSQRDAATLMRPTLLVTAPDNDTLIRAKQVDRDATIRQTRIGDPDATVAKGQMPPAEIDAITTRKEHSPTAARSLQSQFTSPPTPVPLPPVDLESVDRTQPIASRLVLSLGEAPVHGDLQPGTLIKQRFLLDTLIGKGGMGLVFSAIDRRKEEAQDPNPRVALKVLNADFQAHPQSFIALQREARKAQTLAHPNVVTVFDFDRDGDAVYMTMELLKGRSLESITREARGKGIGRDLALPIIRGIAEGLAYAHRKGIVHSDLKPGNIFIMADNTPKILDFGIARAVPNLQSDEAPDVFDAGSLGAYTEAYATNEMVNGIDPHPADDMYALGIIGHELLTGFHPFQRHSAPNARKLGIRPASLKGLRRKEARALERCLSFERKDRPKDAGEFLKLFRGVSTLQKTTIAVAAVLAVASAFFWYRSYLETSPTVAFASLPAQTQRQFNALIIQGDEEWAFFEREHNLTALQSAVEQYSRAYALHPRNRDAVRGLQRSADALLKAVGSDAERREIATFLREQSDYFKKYPPVTDAAG